MLHLPDDLTKLAAGRDEVQFARWTTSVEAKKSHQEIPGRFTRAANRYSLAPHSP